MLRAKMSPPSGLKTQNWCESRVYFEAGLEIALGRGAAHLFPRLEALLLLLRSPFPLLGGADDGGGCV